MLTLQQVQRQHGVVFLPGGFANMKLYTSDGCSYEGMSAETVTSLRSELGRSTEFVSKEEYDAYVAAHQPF